MSDVHIVSVFFRFKWPRGFVCPRCNHDRYYLIATRRLPLFQCRSCRHQTSLTAGTVLEGSRTPLHKWATAIQLLTRTDKGTTAVELKAIIKVTYKTAWLMLHKIRHAIHLEDRACRLPSPVKVKTSYYCYPFGKAGDRTKISSIAVAIHTDYENNPHTVKMIQIDPRIIASSLCTHAGRAAFKQCYLHPDAEFDKIIKPFEKTDIKLKLPLKRATRWINCTFHGIGRKYLQAYLDEFSFRYNQEQHVSSISAHTLIRYILNNRRITLKQLNNHIYRRDQENLAREFALYYRNRFSRKTA